MVTSWPEADSSVVPESGVPVQAVASRASTALPAAAASTRDGLRGERIEGPPGGIRAGRTALWAGGGVVTVGQAVEAEQVVTTDPVVRVVTADPVVRCRVSGW
ncbi:hypothetical protein GCM10020229_58820 [Kitasatospora albolonga]